MQHMSTNKQRGFTLVEIAIITPIMILVAISIVAVLIALVTSTVRPNARSIIMQQEEKALDSIEGDVNNSSAILSSTLPSNFSDSNIADYNFPPAGTTVLRVQTYDQIINPNDTTGTKVIPAFKDGSACSNMTNLNSTNILPIVVVYYVKNEVLYRRTLTDNTSPAPAICGTKLAKQTCLTCSSEDLALVRADKLTSFDIIYYTGINNDIVTADPTIAKSAMISITASLEAGGDTVEHTTSLRVARLNN